MWGQVLAAGGASLASGLIGANAAEKAAGQQAAAIDRAVGTQNRQFDLTRADFLPQRELGFAATGRLRSELGLGTDPMAVVLPNGRTVREAAIEAYNADIAARNAAGGAYNAPFEQQGAADQQALLSRYAPGIMQAAGVDPSNLGQGSGFLTRRFSMDDLQSDPIMKASFDFGLSEGEKAVKRMFGAKGLARSGAAVKAATRYASDYANQRGGEAYNRFTTDQNNLYSRLTGAAGMGTQAQQITASAGQNAANNISDLSVQAGNARGAAGIAAGNAIGGAIGNIGNQISGQMNLDRILNRGGISGGFSGGTMTNDQIAREFNF